MAEQLSDEALMDQVRLGSKDAFRELMERWQRSLYRFFCLSGIDPSGAEDCVQEAFLRVFSYRKRYRTIGSKLRGFLFHVSRNVAADFFRKRKRGESVFLESAPCAHPSVHDSVPLWNDRFDCEWALALLPDRLRDVVVLNVYEGLSYREVAEVLAIPVGTVKSRMYHALGQLRETLGVEATS